MGNTARPTRSARAGRVEEANELMVPAVEVLVARDSLALLIAYGHLGFVRLQSSDYSGARAALEKSRDRIIRTYCPFEFAGPTFPLLVESLLGPRWADADGGPSRAVARKAWREARVARFVGWRYPNYAAHSLRVSGRAAYALGKTKKAAGFFERAISAAEKHGRPDTISPAPCSTPPASSPTVPTTTAAAASSCSTSSAPSSPRRNNSFRKTSKCPSVSSPVSCLGR